MNVYTIAASTTTVVIDIVLANTSSSQITSIKLGGSVVFPQKIYHYQVLHLNTWVEIKL